MIISFIDFLNSVPLGWGFLHGSCRGKARLLFDVPSVCAQRLSAGEADVGLIPVIEYPRIPGLSIIPGICIGAKREARSVLFISRVPIQDVTSVAVDASSRTSVALLRIILSEFYGRKDVTFDVQKPDAARMLSERQAALLIGDPALQFNLDGCLVYDLAAEWNAFTGLPFVFAFWAVRSGVKLGAEEELFYQSRAEGLANLPAIAEMYSARLGVGREEILQYFCVNLNYTLDESNREGLEEFYRLAASLNLIQSVEA